MSATGSRSVMTTDSDEGRCRVMTASAIHGFFSSRRSAPARSAWNTSVPGPIPAIFKIRCSLRRASPDTEMVLAWNTGV